MLGYLSGIYDILRINDLERIDRAIQENIERGNKYFALAIYSDKLCEQEGLSTPLKNVEDRMKIAQYISGVDFTFSISSTDNEEINKKAEEAFRKYILYLEEKKDVQHEEKEFDIVYTPGTYDLFHAGHLENLLEATEHSNRLIVGVKSDELVQSHKGRTPVISAQERMEILRHFKFVNDVYQYHTRDPHVAVAWIKSKYGKEVDAIFLGSDLKEDFKNIEDIRLIFTDRDPTVMKTRSTTAYREKLTLLRPTVKDNSSSYKKKKNPSKNKSNSQKITKGDKQGDDILL